MEHEKSDKKKDMEKQEKKTAKEGKGKNLKVIFVALAILVIMGGISYLAFLPKPQNYRNPYQMEFAGEIRNFRANLIEAEKVQVYPSSDALKDIFFGNSVRQINIFYIDTTENGFYEAPAFEFVLKMGIIYKSRRGNEGYSFGEGNRENCLFFYANNSSICFEKEVLKNADDVSGIKSSADNPAIILLGPPFSNKTAVTINNFTVMIEGKSLDETNRKYTDIDLATDRFLLALMGK